MKEIKEKFLVSIEFRYTDKKLDRDDTDFVSKTTTIGVYDTLEDANIEGNKALEILEKNFKLHRFPQGSYAERERFSKNGGCFGSRKSLVTNLAYLKTPFEFYAKVQRLQYTDLQDAIDEAVSACKRYKEYKLRSY